MVSKSTKEENIKKKLPNKKKEEFRFQKLLKILNKLLIGKKTAANYERSAKGKKRKEKYKNSSQGVQAALRNEETRRQKRWDEIEQRKEAEGEEILLEFLREA